MVTVPPVIWYVTNTDLLAHATQHSAHSLTALPRHRCPVRNCCFRLARNKQAGPVQEGPVQIDPAQENKPVASSPAGLCPHPSS